MPEKLTEHPFAALQTALRGRNAAERLGTTVNALEGVRLELLRAFAGRSGGDGLTGNLDALRRLGDRIDATVEAGDP